MKSVILTILLLQLVVCEEINVLVVGKSGAGKSSLINFLIGAPIAKVSHYDTGTTQVQSYQYYYAHYGHTITYYDTPGLFDNNLDMNTILHNIGQIKAVDLILICMDLSQARMYEDDFLIIKTLKTKYGPYIMKHALLIFTKANNIKNADIVARQRYQALEIVIPYILISDSYYETSNGYRSFNEKLVHLGKSLNEFHVEALVRRNIIHERVIQETRAIWQYDVQKSYELNYFYKQGQVRPELIFYIISTKTIDLDYWKIFTHKLKKEVPYIIPKYIECKYTTNNCFAWPACYWVIQDPSTKSGKTISNDARPPMDEIIKLVKKYL